MFVKRIFILAFVLLFLNDVSGRIMPDYITACDFPNQECLRSSVEQALPFFVKGEPKFGFQSLDPFFVKKFVVPVPGIEAAFTDGKVTGLRNCVVEHTHWVEDSPALELGFRCNITVRGKYFAKGQILTFNIDGDGDAKIQLTNAKLQFNLKHNVKKLPNGEIRQNIKNYKYFVNYGDKVTFSLTNLFKDSPELTQVTNAFFNENWRMLTETFGKPVVDQAIKLGIAAMQKFFDAVPCNEIYKSWPVEANMCGTDRE